MSNTTNLPPSSMSVWLKRNGYANVVEWAQDSDYHYDADRGGWCDEDDNWVDIEEMCKAAKDVATEIVSNGHQRDCAYTILTGEQPIPRADGQRGDDSAELCDCGANSG